jgi:hypothetical protein
MALRASVRLRMNVVTGPSRSIVKVMDASLVRCGT